jgi:hypothetical protein
MQKAGRIERGRKESDSSMNLMSNMLFVGGADDFGRLKLRRTAVRATCLVR